MSSQEQEGQRMALLRTTLDRTQERLVKKLDQPTFINNLPKVTSVIFPCDLLGELYYYNDNH
jgi:hypothetical protein